MRLLQEHISQIIRISINTNGQFLDGRYGKEKRMIWMAGWLDAQEN